MKTKPGGRGLRTDIPPELPAALKALDDATLLDALEEEAPGVATRALHERLRKKPAPTAAFCASARVLLARIVFRSPQAAAANAAQAYGFSGPDGALLLEALRGALEKATPSNAFAASAARALVDQDADAYTHEWPTAARIALVNAATKTLTDVSNAARVCADASRDASVDDPTRAVALHALAALAKRDASCAPLAARAACDCLRRPCERRRFAVALLCLKGSPDVSIGLAAANDEDACLRGRCACLEAVLPALNMLPATMWVELVEVGLGGDAGARRAAVDLACGASRVFGFESSGALQCVVQMLMSARTGVDELCRQLLDTTDHDARCGALAAELLLGAPVACRVRACRAALQARSQSTSAFKLLDDEALNDALTDADDACRSAAVEVLGRRHIKPHQLAAFFDDQPLAKALKCCARRLSKSSLAVELGALACAALTDEATEGNACAVLEGLSGPHALEIVNRCHASLVAALQTSHWDRRRRVYYDLLRIGNVDVAHEARDFSDAGARLAALSTRSVEKRRQLATHAEATPMSKALGALALVADDLDMASSIAAAAACARDLRLFGGALPAVDGDDSSDDEGEDESETWHGCRNCCALAAKVARRAPSQMGDAALDLMLRTRHTGAINGAESVLRAACAASTDEDRRRWLKLALTSCRRPDDSLAQRRSAGLGAAHAAILDTDPSLAPHACRFLVTVAKEGAARDAKRALNVLSAVADRAHNALRHDLGSALGAALIRADDADWGCRGAAALCAAAILRRLYRDERFYDGTEGDLHRYSNVKEAVDAALARDGPIGRTVALRCIRGCRASMLSQETWLMLLGASEGRVRTAAAETLASLDEAWCTPSNLCINVDAQADPNGAHGLLTCCALLPPTTNLDDVKALIRCASRLAPKNSEELWCPPVHLAACNALRTHASTTPRLKAAENACAARVVGKRGPDALAGAGRFDAALAVARCARLLEEDANEALALLDQAIKDPVAVGLLRVATRACGVIRDDRFFDDLDVDADAEVSTGRVPPYVVQAELRRLISASPVRRAAALKLALAAAANGILAGAVVEVEVPQSIVEASSKWPEAQRAVVAQLRAILANDPGPALQCFRANGGVLLRRGAARACALLQDPPSTVVQACLALACDGDARVRAAAADALAPGLSPAAAVVDAAARFDGVVPVVARALLARRAALAPAEAPPPAVPGAAAAAAFAPGVPPTPPSPTVVRWASPTNSEDFDHSGERRDVDLTHLAAAYAPSPVATPVASPAAAVPTPETREQRRRSRRSGSLSPARLLATTPLASPTTPAAPPSPTTPRASVDLPGFAPSSAAKPVAATPDGKKPRRKVSSLIKRFERKKSPPKRGA